MRVLLTPKGLLLTAFWLATLIAAAALGWFLGREEAVRSVEPPPPVAEQAPLYRDLTPDALARIIESAAEATEDPDEEPAPEVEAEPAPPPPKPKAKPKPAPKPAPAPEPVAPAVVEPVAPVLGPLVRALQTARKAERGEPAEDEAQQLLNEHPSFTELVEALADDGAGEPQASLTALRVIQIAGHDEISRQLARTLKREHAATEEVASSIRRWKILEPRIAEAETAVEEGRIVVRGTLENPDLAAIRRVEVEVEALDAAGNVIDTVEVKVRPKLLPGQSSTEFFAIFKNVDAGQVVKTRSTITAWQFEVAP